ADLVARAVVRRSARSGRPAKRRGRAHGRGLGFFHPAPTGLAQGQVQDDAGAYGHQQEVVVDAHPVIAARRRAQAVVTVIAHDIGRTGIPMTTLPARMAIARVDGVIAVAAVVPMTIAVAVVSVIVVVPIVCVASLDLAMIAFPMVMATMVVIAMAGVGQRQTAAGKQGDGNKQ